ncbi:ubiquitin-conjugating enzyme E2 27 isoform X1 [Sesamum indicum]|uniref:Ubiquitin-conjugating enzyme E2 27 isoform X1 n=1 Tax=Sesamum indicum TaxID=4182 RepID=A0A6I9SUP9_SESIN|nr:ubiquitin-conjugating enzyme E2 27 isoform X1 [Sesamum indicum]
MVDFARVQKELQECNRDFQVSGIKVMPKGEANLAHLLGTIPGPIGTPYEGGTFKIDITLPAVKLPVFPIYVVSECYQLVFSWTKELLTFFLCADGYPFEPPKMKFATKVWHPNISSQSGAICLDILKDQWSPALTLKTALLSIQALLSAPEPDDPQDAVVAQQYLRDYQTFLGTARYWTEAFAMTSSLGVEEKVQKLVEMGFPEDLVRTTLENVGGDENLALEKLCST